MKRIVCFGAHPDDIEFGCGGTIAHYQQQNAHVTFVCLTSGESGHSTMRKEELAALREREARTSARQLGVIDVRFLHFSDGLTYFTREMKVDVINIIRALRPDVVFTHSTCDEFPDHHLCSRLTLDALTAAAGPWYQESTGMPHRVSEVYGYEVWQPMSRYQIAHNITEVLENKLASLKCHESQIAHVSYDAAARGLAAYRGAMSMTGDYAEVFEVMSTKLNFF